MFRKNSLVTLCIILVLLVTACSAPSSAPTGISESTLKTLDAAKFTPVIPSSTPETRQTAAASATPKPQRTATFTPVIPSSTPKPRRTATPTPDFSCTPTLTGGTTPRIPTLTLSKLLKCRPEAQTTINLIKRNGPFKFDQDDVVFSNREGFLPSRPNGTYHEYTVITLGASTRGTRRIITAGLTNRKPADFTVLYYTDDHYQTFWLVQGN